MLEDLIKGPYKFPGTTVSLVTVQSHQLGQCTQALVQFSAH